jgi:hypothetical protein
LPKASAAKAIISNPQTVSQKPVDTAAKAEAKIPLPLFMIPGAYHKSRFYGFHVQQPKESPRLPWPLLHEARMRHHVIDPKSAKILHQLMSGVREIKETDRKKRAAKILDLVVKASKQVSANKRRSKSPVVRAKAKGGSKKGGPVFARKDYQPTTEMKGSSSPASGKSSIPPPLYPAVSAAEA